MPSQPRSPSLRLNAGSTPESQVSTWVVKLPAASSSARNARTSSRTCSAAADRGAGASVNELLPMQCSPRRCGCLHGSTGRRVSRRGRGQGGPMSDPFDLQRFVDAQDGGGTYLQALAELRAGAKRSHWMWFVFPQLAGLGRSATAQRYAVASLDEARAYLRHPVLGERLRVCARVVAETADEPQTVFGAVDAMKLRSSMTLFARAAPEETVFTDVLARHFDGEPDGATERLLS